MSDLKFRITTNGFTFKVERFFEFLWFKYWVTEWESTLRDGSTDLEFKTKAAAEDHIKSQHLEAKRRVAKWRVIDDKNL